MPRAARPGSPPRSKEQQATTLELERRVQQLASILDFMAKPLAELDEQVQRQLVPLAGAIARQIVRRELKPIPTRSSP